MYRQSTLENGIRIITDTMTDSRAVSLGIIVQAGPRQDPAGRRGLAHLAEHTIFSGTGSRTADEIARLMDIGGGQMGAFTTRDYTCFFATVLDDYYTYTLDLLGDILLNSIFPTERVEREKTAVLHEIAAGRDSADHRAHDLLKQTAWPDHPLGRPIVGHPDEVQAIDREDLIYFVHEHYQPDRLIVTAAGNLDHDDFVAQVRDALWRMLGHTDEAATPAPPVYNGGVAVAHMPVSQAYFSIGLPALPYAHPDRYDLHALSNLLGGGISSRLFHRLREEQGLVYHIGSEYHAYADAGLWLVEGSTTPETLPAVMATILMEWWELLLGDAPPTAEEVWRTKMQLRGQHLIGSEDTNTRMSRLATQHLYFNDHIPTADLVARIEAVTVNSLKQIATTFWPAMQRPTLTAVTPADPDMTHMILEQIEADFRLEPIPADVQPCAAAPVATHA